MKHLVVALITVCALSSSVLADEEELSAKFDNIDVDAIINNDRLLNGYVGCLLDRNPCTPDAAELKSKYVATAKRPFSTAFSFFNHNFDSSRTPRERVT